MKKILVIILGIIFLSNLSFGQTKYKPHVRGDKAVLFTFSGLSNLGAGSYQGGIGYKKFINPKTALRGAFDIYNYNGKISWGPEFYPTGYVGEDGKSTAFRIGLNIAGEIHKNKGKVDPYFGGGVGFSMKRTKYIEPVFGPQGTALTATEIKNDLDDDANTSFSIFGLFGIEYAINSVLTLAAEYKLGFNYVGEPDMQVTDPSGIETSYSGSKYSYISLGSVGFLTLAIYLN